MNNHITIYRWIDNNHKITYVFGDSKSNEIKNINFVPLPIFYDDTIDTVLKKVAAGITWFHKNDKNKLTKIDLPPYIWNKQSNLRFKVSFKQHNDSVKYPINPWESAKLPIIKNIDAVDYYDQNQLNANHFNIVLFNDLPKDIRENAYYFPDINIKSWQYPSFESLEKEATLLLNIYKSGSEKTLPSFILTKSRWISSSINNDPVILYDIFQKMHTSQFCPFIQYYEDTYKILYKLNQNHNIPYNILSQWTSFDRTPKIPTITGMFHIPRRNIWARATLNTEGQIVISYNSDVRGNLDWSIMSDHSKKIKAWFEQFLKTKKKIKIQSIYGKFDIRTPSINLNIVMKEFSNIPSVFHVLKNQNGILEVACLRSTNYKQSLDILDYISLRIGLGIPITEILSDLIELGITDDEAKSWLEEYQSSLEGELIKKKQRRSLFSGCILRIVKTQLGFGIYVDNASSLEEMYRISHWVIGTFDKLFMNVATKQKTNVAPETNINNVISSDKSSLSSRSKSSDIINKAEKELGDVDLSDLDFSGGGSILQDLQQADPGIFIEVKDYARKCAANNNRQPIVVSNKEMETYKKEGYTKGYDNELLYGSDPSKQNYYICPRIWCPMARIPLTYEQLDKNNGLCPGPHKEEPVLLYNNAYWDKDKERKHYVGFLKDKTPSGACIPCCMKKPLKETELSSCKVEGNVKQISEKEIKKETKKVATEISGPGPSIIKEQQKLTIVESEIRKDEYYIMGAPAPLPLKRNGTIPKDLHYILQPNVPYSTCNKTLTTTPCYVRTGIGYTEDSFMESIATIMGVSKKELIEKIKKFLDPLTFITLEQSTVLQAFMDPLAPIISTNLEKEWKQWIKKSPKYVEYFMLNIDKLSHERLQRELAIYRSYLNFIKHMHSNEPKNPQHFFDLFARMGYIFLLWKRKGLQHAHFHCPSYININLSTAQYKKAFMIIEDDNEHLYEPIEWKQRGKNGKMILDINDIENVATFLDQCSKKDITWISILRSMKKWIESFLVHTSPFIINGVILNPDLRIYGLITEKGFIIKTTNNGLSNYLLKDIIELFNIKHIYYHEDIVGKTYNIYDVLINDIRLLEEKLKTINFTLIKGNLTFNINDPSNITANYIVKIPPINNLNPPAIIIPTIRNYLLNNENKKWYQISILIGKTLYKYYDSHVNKILLLERSEQINILKNKIIPELLENNIPSKKLQIILEEVPYWEGKEAILSWMKSIGVEEKERIYYINYVIPTDKKEWLFSQAAVEKGLPVYNLLPQKGPRPLEEFSPNDVKLSEYNSKKVATNKPSLLNNIEKKSLPVKFSQIKNYSWSSHRICISSDYNEKHIIEFVDWLFKYTGVPISWAEVTYSRNRIIGDILVHAETIPILLQDPSFVAAWSEYTKKTYKSGKDLWTRTLQSMKPDERKNIWIEHVSKSKLLKPCDIDMYMISRLFGVNILTIYRSKYGGEIKKRGDLEDLATSSTLYYVANEWKNVPLFIFYKEPNTDTKEIVYSIIVNSKDEFVYPITKNIPTDIYLLLEYLVNNQESYISEH